MSECSVETICGREFDWGREEAGNATVSGVFPDLVNRAAFVDKLVLGIHGKLRKRMDPAFTDVSNRAIGGWGRPYARSIHGIYEVTGNPFEVKYGRNPRYPKLFNAKVIIRSEGKATSFDEANEIPRRLFWKGYRSIPQGVEFTFDVTIPFRFFENHIRTRASVRTLNDESNWRTLYAGAVEAPWMLRVYQKTRKIIRVEFVLRHSFLVKAGIKDLESLKNLKNFPFSRLVRFPAICQRAFEDLIRGKAKGKQLELLLDWPGRRPSRTLLEMLEDYGLEGDAILRKSPEEQLLEKMRERFTW